MKIYCMLLFVPVVLSGCQLPAKSITVMPLKNTDTQYNAEQIQNAQNNLYLSGAINQVRAPLFTPGISANSQRVTLNRDGDAVELLSHLARQRGLTFNWTGVRLPLPVNLHVNGVTYQNLLRMIEVQTAWRATLHEFPGQLTLVFLQPEKPRGRR
ncbi:DotD/TraH family lipoprotein [Serratia sp. CY55921]|uniref:DotD/TraH family lipoprotein n=1 Tax=Serratia sp. CY55921 TaxID=3383640 RepID=UPI003FA1647B